MKLTHYYIYIALAMLTACAEDSLETSAPTYTVGEADNAIVLRAGISEGGAGVQTRALENPDGNHDSGTNGGGHVRFTPKTLARLRVDGTWKKTESGIAEDVRQVTTITMGGMAAESGNDAMHNSVASYSPQLYWDDYGTADPNNKTEGRAQGLTIYGVAVDGYVNGSESKSLPPALSSLIATSDWTSLAWTLDTDQKTNDWKNKDLLISNNVKYNGDPFQDNAYKFDARGSGKLLEFTHAMSKITVRLIANYGFPTDGSVGNTTYKFNSTPEVVLTSNEGTATTNTEWPYTSGNVDITTGAVTSQNNNKVTMHAQSTTDATYTAIYDALVVPGSCFGATNDAIIARINADGNIYYVTAEKIRDKMYNLSSSTDYKTEAGKNYIITVRVNKTKIEKITATVKNWIDVEADLVEPVINVSTSIGGTTEVDNAFNSFDFYLSDNAEVGYSTNYNTRTAIASAPTTGNKTDGTKAWTFSPLLYWPSHSTHYHMRGVYPSSTTVTNGKISVTAGDYNSTTSPSNIMVGAPVFTESNKNCDNSDHASVDMSQHGICAREANINLNFNYMMTQVEVRLTTPALGNDKVNLANAKVEIIDGYTAGDIDVHNKTVATSGSTFDFVVNHITDEDANYRHSIVVPQNLSHDATALKFRITIYKSESTTEVDDVYTAVIKDIKVKDPSTSETSKNITAWESGKHYVYTLDMRKTEVKITATLTDWVTVTASEDIWF